VVTTAVDSKVVTKPPVSVASIRFKVLRFDIGPIIGLYLGNITDLGHPEVRCKSAMTGDAKSKLK